MANTLWSRQQTLAALHVYFQLPFGRLHQRDPTIRQLAQWIGRTPDAVALKLVNFASLDPQIRASGRVGMRNASRLDEQIWDELNANWDATAAQATHAYEHFSSAHGEQPGFDVVDEVPEIAEGQTISAVVEVRGNQARFRRAVLASYKSSCCISGLAVPQLLIASHIVPWSMDAKNRLNPQNGLCLSALHDKAYDLGLITVLPDFTVRVSARLKGAELGEFARDSLARFDGCLIQLPERLGPNPEFLAAHAVRFGFV